MSGAAFPPPTGEPAPRAVTPAGSDVVAATRDLCDLARRVTAGGPFAPRAAAIATRFEGPLRVAIAGRVKAGKSTLLNALVGERLATTDAGECTRIVTVYRHADGYEVAAVLRDGTRRPLTFRRHDGALAIDLGHLSQDDVATLEVGWPSAVLRRITLIDTPGLASLDGPTSRRTLDFFDRSAESTEVAGRAAGGSTPAADDGVGSGADAVVYLMRHLHRADGEFLAAFMDRTVIGASPVNAVAVLSRADEVGAGRLDAMESAGVIAGRYSTDPAVSSLVAAVVPVAGLLAETALTLREDEVAALRSIAGCDPAERERLLLSADDFCDSSLSPITAERRRDLLDRLGVYGVRCSIAALLASPTMSAGELSRSLAERSGIAALHDRLSGQFGPRSRVLQARSALMALRSLTVDLAAAPIEAWPDGIAAATRLRTEIDRLEASAVAFARLSALHLVMSATAVLPAAERDEVITVLGDSPDPGLDHHDPAAGRVAALAGIERWRRRADDPVASSAVVMVADTMVRLYEHRYVNC
jgi:hypothetical protein